MLRLLSLFLTCSVLVSCASTGSKLPRAEALGAIGVVSVLGDTFTGFEQGVTRFGNSRYTANVADWKVDDFVTNQVIGMLKASQAKSVERLSIGSVPVSSFYPVTASDLDPAPLLAAAKSQGSTTLVVVSLSPPYWPPHELPGTGYGWFSSGFGPLNSRRIFATFRVSVFDVANGKLIAWSHQVPAKAMPALDVPWRKSFDEFSPAEVKTLKLALESYLAAGVRLALEDLGLIPRASTS